MKRRIRRKEKKQKKIIITLSVFLILFLSVGYATFNAKIVMKAKGNIVVTDTAENCFTVSDNGDGTGTITDYDATCGPKVKIPNMINNLTVTKIAAAELANDSTLSKSFVNKKITTIILPNTLEEIGYAAFNENQITKLTIPDSVKKIDQVAFRHNYISKLNLPNHYIEMGPGVFNDNKLSENEAFIYKQNTDGSYDNTVIISYAGIKESNITIPSTVKILAEWSFRAIQNNKLSEITIPDNVELIKGEAIEFNTYLTQVNIGNGVKKIDYKALANNPNLKKVTIGSGIQTMAKDTFFNCNNLEIININRKENAVEGAPWGAINATINWTGTN